MTPALEQSLIEKYPHFFARWSVGHFQCGDGWHHLIDTFCALITNHERVIDEDAQRIPDEDGVVYKSSFMLPNGSQNILFHYRAVKIQQIKESYGSLLIRFTGGDGFVVGAIRTAEVLSLHTCSQCGNKKSVNATNRGFYSLCTMCVVRGGIEESDAGLTTELDFDMLAPEDDEETDLNGLEKLADTMSPEEKDRFLKRIGVKNEEDEG